MEFTICFNLNNYILSLIMLKLSTNSISSRKNELTNIKMWFDL